MQKACKEKRTSTVINLKKNMKTLILLVLITLSNFIIANKTKNFLVSKKSEKTENQILKATEKENTKHLVAAEALESRGHLLAQEKSTLAGLTRTTAANVAFVQLHESTKTNMHFKMSNQVSLSSKAHMQVEIQSMKKILDVVNEGSKSNKDLPSVSPSLQPDLSYLEKRVYETEITTEEFSTSLRLSKEQLGRYTWAVLHSMASAFPLVADETHQKAIKSFIENIVLLFSCHQCGKKFAQLLKDNPVKCSGRVELANYLCDLHNKVNVNLKKPVFDCSKILEFWGGESKAKLAGGI